MAEYEKIKRVSIPLNDDYLLLVSMDIDTNHSSLIYRILDLIKQ